MAEEKVERQELDMQNTKAKGEKLRKEIEELKKMKGLERIEQ